MFFQCGNSLTPFLLGTLALVNHNGNVGAADGQVSTMGIIDLTLNPPREVDLVVVGDGPEGLGGQTAGYAVTRLTNGSGGSVPDNAFFRHDHAIAVLLTTDGKTVHKVGQTEVGTLAEGIAFSPDSRNLYVANWGEQNLSTYRLDDNKLVLVGTPLKLPGHPGSMRGSAP